MALNLTDNLRQQLKSPELTPTMVVVIDGYPIRFGNVSIKTFIRIGDPDLIIDGSWLIGGFRLLPNQSSYIQFSTGTTTKITQKLDPSRGQGSSISSMAINLVDFQEQMTRLVSPGFELDDVLARRVTVFIGAQESSWPEDYNPVFRGIVQSYEAGAGFVVLNLSNTDEKKRVQIVPRTVAQTAQKIDYRSATFQDLFFQNREDVVNVVTVEYVGGGTAGAEVVSIVGGGYTIRVQIEDGVSIASKIRKAIESHDEAMQLIREVKVTGDSSAVQFVGSATLGIDLVLELDDASFFLLPDPANGLRTYARVGEELMEYTGKTGNQLTGLVRAENDSLGDFHNIEKEVTQVLKLTGHGLDLALKLMLSDGPEFYAQNIKAQSIVYFSPTVSQANTIFVQGVDLETDFGVCAGDLASITGASLGPNNVTDSAILEVGRIADGSYLVLSDSLLEEMTTAAVLKFKSQFNVLPIGLGMVPAEVDVAQHLYIRDTFLPTFDMDLFFEEISNGKDFMDKSLYLPMTCFSVPRKGRSSVIYTVGPLPNHEIITLNLKTVKNPSDLRVVRSTSENFFNQVQFNYQWNPVTQKFDRALIKDAENGPTNIGIRPFRIDAPGMTDDTDASVLADRAARRLLRRYERGANFIKGIKVMFSDGYATEIGDVVAVDFDDLQLSDFEKGQRGGGIKLMEILNKVLDKKTGEVQIDVVNTIFGTGDRFGLISPASEVLAGSTTTKLLLKKSWGTKPFQPESLKWRGYEGQTVIVVPEDWSQGPYTTVIRGFDSNDPQGMSIDPIPVAPGQGWIVKSPDYPSSTNQADQAFWKARHAFLAPTVPVVSGTDQRTFTVDSGDAGKFFVGSIVRVHDYEYTEDSVEAVVSDITGSVISVDRDLGFTPNSDHIVDLIGFPDEQQAYRVV